jgi:hypothetical protein
MPRGGQNLKSKAIQTIKRELEFRTCASGEKVPISDLNDWCRAMNTLLSIRIVGVSYLRYAAKQLTIARTVWKTPKQQEALNAVAALLIKAEERCADRAAKRADKRLLKAIVQKPPTSTPTPASAPTLAPAAAQESRRKLWETIAEDTNGNNRT